MHAHKLPSSTDRLLLNKYLKQVAVVIGALKCLTISVLSSWRAANQSKQELG